VRTVLSSHEVLGGAASGEVVVATAAFRDRNPVLYKAVLAALEESISTINADKRRSAEIYVAETHAKEPVDLIFSIISRPQVEYSVVPKAVMRYADFLYKRGRIKRQPANWSNMFFPEIHDRPGS
jgi:NitT/TauT family transport system substrate-binding protein